MKLNLDIKISLLIITLMSLPCTAQARDSLAALRYSVEATITDLQAQITLLKAQAIDTDGKDQLISVKEDINSRYEGLDNKLTAIDVKIQDMEDQDQDLAFLIGDAVLAANENSTLLTEKLQQKDDLDTLIQTVEDNIDELLSDEVIDQQAIDQNQSEVEALNDELVLVHNAIATISPAIPPLFAKKQGIDKLIGSLYQLKAEISGEEEEKQELLSVSCSEGELLSTSVNGSLTCTSIGSVENAFLIPMRITIYGPWVEIPAPRKAIKVRRVKSFCRRIRGEVRCRYKDRRFTVFIPGKGVSRSVCPEGTLLTSRSALTIFPTVVYSLNDGLLQGETTARGKTYSRYRPGAIRAVSYCMGGI